MSNISSATKLLVCCVFCILQPEPVQLGLEVYSYKMEWKDSLIDVYKFSWTCCWLVVLVVLVVFPRNGWVSEI